MPHIRQKKLMCGIVLALLELELLVVLLILLLSFFYFAAGEQIPRAASTTDYHASVFRKCPLVVAANVDCDDNEFVED